MIQFTEILDRKIEHYGDTKAAHEFAAEEYASEIIKEHLGQGLKLLTDAQRMDVFSGYCKACGSPGKNCQCWNDE